MYSFASHGYGSDRIFLSISGLVKKYTEHCFCNPSKNWGFKKQRPKCPSSYSLWKLGKNFKRKSDSNSHKKFQQLWEFTMIRFSVLWAYKAKTSSQAICETVGKALWVSIVARTDSYIQPENLSFKIQTRTYAFVRWPCRWRFGTWYYYLRQAVYVGRIVTKHLNKCASI